MQKVIGPFLLVFYRDCQLVSVSVGPHTFGLSRGVAQPVPRPYHYDSRKDG